MSHRENHAFNTVLLMVASGLIGAAAALLVAPQSGKKTRSDIRKFTNKVATRAEEFQEELRDRVDDLVEDLVQASNNGLEKGRDVTVRVRDELVGTLQASRDLLSQQIDRVEGLFRK